MGTDIHSYVDRKNEDGKWETLRLYTKTVDNEYVDKTWEITDDRNYALFEKLAGVRGFVSPMVDLRGLPKDLTNLEMKDYYGENGEDKGCWHSETWYDYCELCALAQTPGAISDDEDDEEPYNPVAEYLAKVNAILQAYDVYYPNPGEVRIVMWFDS